MAKGINLDGGWKAVVIVAMLAVLVLYLFGQVTENPTHTCTQQDITDELYGCYAVGQSVQTGLQYKAPSAEDLQTMPVQILKFLLVGAFVLGFWALAVKLGGGSVGKKDAFVIVLVIIAIIMAWNPLIKPILGATDLNTLTFNIGQKLGILTP